MSTLQEMAVEYRQAAALLRMGIRRKKDAGAPDWELAVLRGALRNVREVQRLLDGYYAVPRESRDCSVDWKAGRVRSDK